MNGGKVIGKLLIFWFKTMFSWFITFINLYSQTPSSILIIIQRFWNCFFFAMNIYTPSMGRMSNNDLPKKQKWNKKLNQVKILVHNLQEPQNYLQQLLSFLHLIVISMKDFSDFSYSLKLFYSVLFFYFCLFTQLSIMQMTSNARLQITLLCQNNVKNNEKNAIFH